MLFCMTERRKMLKDKILNKFNQKQTLYVPLIFFILSIIGVMGADVSFSFLKRELLFRFVANGITILSLIIPIYAGMGLNFALVIGALASQAAIILVASIGANGFGGLLLSILLTLILATFLGNIVGALLNKAKGKEMIASIVIGIIGFSIYQMIFIVLYGSIIKPLNTEILLSNGIGVRNMIDIFSFKDLIMKAEYVPILVTFGFGLFILYLQRTRFGHKIMAVGQNPYLASSRGIDVDKIRKLSIIISINMAGIGHLFYMYSLGIVNVYSGHLHIDIFACAALLAGGATIKRASVLNAFVGLVLFHTMFIVSPLAAQNVFANVAIGEYFRSFLAYAVIVFALILNIKKDKLKL